MKHSKKKKKRSQPPKRGDNVSAGNSNADESGEESVVKFLTEAFSLASVEEAKSAYAEANRDLNKAAEILSGLSDDPDAFQSSSSNSTQSFGLDSSSSEGFTDSTGSNDGLSNGDFRGNKGKKLVAGTGTVSNVIGKNYVSPRKELVKQKGIVGSKVNIDEAEQFLCSMLGEGSELSLGVVKDVLCNCGYDVEKALEVLLDLSAPLGKKSINERRTSFRASYGEGLSNIDFIDNFWQRTNMGSDSCSHSFEGDIQEREPLLDKTCRKYAEALVSSNSSSKLPVGGLRTQGSELPQQVLDSLFNVPKKSERDPASMNWRNVVKQMECFAKKRVEHCSSGSVGPQLNTLAKGGEYQVFRETARQEWDKMRSCYQKAATAYSNGEKNYASYMSEQGKSYSKMAREADEKASMEIFKARNKDIENILTIDLHGQHVKPAMRLVKLHFLFGTYISSVQYLRIITGCGSNGMGKSKLKQSVMHLVKKEGIEWREENQGTLLIKLDGPREFSFLDSGSDSDSG